MNGPPRNRSGGTWLAILIVAAVAATGWVSYSAGRNQSVAASVSATVREDYTADETKKSVIQADLESVRAAKDGSETDAPADKSAQDEQTETQAEKQEAPAADKQEQIVYWVPGGKVWHTSRSCRTLARSKTVESGTIEESGKERECQVCG